MKRRTLLAALATAPLLACGRQLPPRTARLWFTYGGKNRLTLERLVARFNDRGGFRVLPVFQGDYFEGLAKLRTAIAAGVAPALSHVVGEVLPYLAHADVLEPLASRTGATQLDLIPALSQAGAFHGGAAQPLVALPFNRSTPIAYLNGALVPAKPGETPASAAPRTWTELRAFAARHTLRRGEQTERYGFGCPIDWWFFAALVGQAGGDLVEADGRLELGGDAAVRALELWRALVRDERTMKPPPGRDYNAWEGTNQDFLAGRTALIWTSTAFLRYLEQTAKFPVIAAPLPADVRAAVPTGGTFWVLLRGAPESEKEAAWAFLRFMHEPEQVAEWAASTGYLPTTHAGAELLARRGFGRARPNDAVALDQLAVARPWPWSPNLFRVQREIVQPRLEGAVLGEESPRAALAAARAACRRLTL